MNLSADALDIFLQKMPMGIAVFNTDLRLRQCNMLWAHAVEMVMERPIATVLPGLHLRDLLPETAVNLSPYIETACAGETIAAENVVLRHGERTHYWNLFFSSLREDQAIVGILFIATDVTEKKRAEKAAQTAERTLLALMDSLPGMAYRSPLQETRHMELVSEGALELTGYAPSQFITPPTASFAALIHPDDRDKTWLALKTAVQEKRPFELQYRIRTADNNIKWVREQGSGLFTPDGELLAVEGFISDMTEQVLSQQILERRVVDRTQKLSALYEMTAISVEEDDLKISLKQALTWALTAVRAQTGLVHLLDDKAVHLHLAVQQQLPTTLTTTLTTVPVDSFWGEGLRTESPIILDVTMQPEEAPPFLQPNTLHVYAGLPIAVRGHKLGVLHIWRRAKRPFSESDVALLAAAAGQMGTTIENARLHRENERLLLLDERNRLARELHDAVTQSLYSMTLFAETNRRFADAGNLEQVTLYSRRLEETAAQSLKEMRLLLHNLRPSILQSSGLSGALQQRLDAVEKRAGIQSRLLCDRGMILLPSVEEMLFHIAEEALNNALKHGLATAVSVTLSQSANHVKMIVEDNGSGFDETNLQDSGGLGLTTMRERAALLGGSLTIDSHSGKTAVVVDLDMDVIKAATASRTMLDLLQE